MVTISDYSFDALYVCSYDGDIGNCHLTIVVYVCCGELGFAHCLDALDMGSDHGNVGHIYAAVQVGVALHYAYGYLAVSL